MKWLFKQEHSLGKLFLSYRLGIFHTSHCITLSIIITKLGGAEGGVSKLDNRGGIGRAKVFYLVSYSIQNLPDFFPERNLFKSIFLNFAVLL